jgi:hypothetical protein
MTQRAAFGADVLDALRDREEVGIRTSGNPRRPVTIWIVVVEGEVFVRSVRGPRGKWYLAAKADGEARLVLDRREVPVRVTAVTDSVAVDAVSRAILSKYAASPYAKTMVSDETVPTTLRLDPAPTP